jgi:hypothetical protein
MENGEELKTQMWRKILTLDRNILAMQSSIVIKIIEQYGRGTNVR